MMAGVTSYSYVVKGEAVMDTGGIPVVIPIYISGEVQDDKVSSAVEISFLGINTRMASIQSGNELYVKDFASGNWVSASVPAIVLISPIPRTAAVLDNASLPFDGHDAVSVKGSHGELMFSHVSNSEIPVLLALLGADKISEPFDLEDISVNIKMDIEEFKVREIEAAFSVAQGGQFASEMLGFPGLSGLGTIDIDLVAIFQNYGGEFGLQIPDR